jgi:hypothetical protein
MKQAAHIQWLPNVAIAFVLASIVRLTTANLWLQKASEIVLAIVICLSFLFWLSTEAKAHRKSKKQGNGTR